MHNYHILKKLNALYHCCRFLQLMNSVYPLQDLVMSTERAIDETTASFEAAETSTLSAVIRKAPGPDDLSATPDNEPSQPRLKTFPTREQAGRSRSFRSAWYQTHPWLEYSQLADAAFCFACRHFLSHDKDGETAFTSVGFNNWKRAHESNSGLTQHAKSDSHMTAIVMCTQYRELKDKNVGSVMQLQSEAYCKQVSENRQYVKTVAEVLLLTATQNIAQRGHREHSTSLGENPGNFRKILQLLTKHDSSMCNRFSDGNVVTRYTSKDIQNEMLATLSDMVREGIVEEVKQSEYFTVLVDETKDVSKQEQVSFVLRYFANQKVQESFIDFKPAQGLDANSLSNLILSTLTIYGLDVKSCLVGQGYDGASVMSGSNKGVQQIVRQYAPLAMYTHCYAHRLNLVLVDSCKSVIDASDFFGLLEKLYVFFSGSVVHKRWVDVQNELHPGEPVRQLQRLSDTRWACRVVACRNLRDRLDAVICTLEDIVEESHGDRATDAQCLLSMIDYKFVLLLHLFCHLLGKIHGVSTQLQADSTDLTVAAELVQTLLTTLKDTRADGEFVDNIDSDARSLCAKCKIDCILQRRRARRMPRRYDNSLTDESVGHRTAIDTLEAFRLHIYLPVIDCIIGELERRFSDSSLTVMLGVQALTPKHSSFLDKEKLEAFTVLYHGNVEDAGHEIYQLQRLLQRAEQSSKVFTLLDLACFLQPYKLAFHQLYRLLTIAIVLPVTSAACERSFSALKLIKSYLRNTMCDSRLSNIAVLSVESRRAELLNLDNFVDEFDARHNNRKLALH